jgi:hypothetical protein
VPYAAEYQSNVGFGLNWLLLAVNAFAVEGSLLCLSLLLDKKHYRVQTGRKFFAAESLTKSASKRQ